MKTEKKCVVRGKVILRPGIHRKTCGGGCAGELAYSIRKASFKRRQEAKGKK